MTADAAAVAPATGSPPHQGKSAHPHEGGYRDTVESILIAFILAFIFRTFVVEAFVIPTGSMAPTLLGAHARFTCKACSYEFESNFSSGGDDQNIPAVVGHGSFPTGAKRMSEPRIFCPNCGRVVHDPEDNADQQPVPIHYGDRILVLKYAYLLREPARWDVVVFKSPDDPTGDVGWYVTNFIKRLVGKPGETLMVLDGDIYVSNATGLPDGTIPTDFKIQHKPRHVQDALWRIVCDGDYLPVDGGPWQPWVAEDGSGWDIGTSDKPKRVYSFDGSSGGSGTLRFDTEFKPGNPGIGAFTDFLAYAQQESGKNNVSDVKLSLLYDRTSGEGPLRLRLTKGDDTFTAELTPGSVALFRKRGGTAAITPDDLGDRVAFAENIASLAAKSGPVQVDFMNADHVVTLRVADEDVVSTSYDPNIAELRDAYANQRKMPKPQIRITASAQTCNLSHVSLWRDVYYTNTDAYGRIRTAQPDAPVTLGKDEYFTMGDNTVISQDARYWRTPIKLPYEDLDVEAGRVPGRFLLGKAFFVYWPAGYRPLGWAKSPGLIPNFGDMRFIH